MRIPWVLVATVVLLAAVGCRTQPVYDVSGAPLPIGTSLGPGEIGEAIQRAGVSLGWSVVQDAPGRMTGTLRVRKHVAIVSITYDTKSFDIRYQDSTNLRYGGGEIHRNYNRWVRRLEQRIQEELFAR